MLEILPCFNKSFTFLFSVTGNNIFLCLGLPVSGNRRRAHCLELYRWELNKALGSKGSGFYSPDLTFHIYAVY